MRIHPVTGAVAYDDHSLAREVAWFGDLRFFQRCGDTECDRILAPVGGEGTPVLPHLGSNEIRGGQSAWHSMLVESGVPTLRFNYDAAVTRVGFAGAVAASADVSIVFDATKTTVVSVQGAVHSQPIPLGGGAFGRPFVEQQGRVASVCLESGALVLIDLTTQQLLPAPQGILTGRYWPVCFYVDAELWIGYQCSLGFIIHPAYDASRWLFLTGPTDNTFGLDACVIGTDLVVKWASEPSESRASTTGATVPLATLRAVTSRPLPELPPVKPIGPLSDPLPEGTVIPDLAEYLKGDPATFPRTHRGPGNGHPIHQYVFPDDENRFLFMKFGPSATNDSYEEMRITPDWIHQIVDASNRPLVSFSDTRWYPRRMPVGLAHLWESPPHEVVERRRETCAIFNRWGFRRKQGIFRAWERFDCGPDLGVREVVCLIYDPTEGIYAEDRAIELGWFARGCGPIRWEAHNSKLAMASGTFQPSDATLRWDVEQNRPMRSDFYYLGGPAWVPNVSQCVLPISPEVPPAMKIPLSVQTKMQAFAGRFGQPPAGDGPIHDYSRRMAEQVAFSFNTATAEWGLKSSAPGNPTSNNLTLRDAAGIHTWDWIVGSAGPAPTLNIENAEYFFVPNQHFIPVTPIDHLGTPVPPSKFPPLVLPFWGASAFDLAARVSAPVSDWRYYDELKRRRVKPRVQCYATITHPATGRLYRDFGTGLSQLRVLLPRMAADGMQGQFTYLVGTTPDGVSRSEAINRIRQLDALVCSFPSVVAGRQGGNELYYPGLEEPYMSEDGFWREVEAILDPRFPWTRGAGHGGAGVNMSGGSYFVHHSNRDLTPDQAGEILGAAQRLGRGNVIDDEPRRIEAGGSGQATGDLNFVRGLIANAKRHGYGLTLHNAAGRGCSVDFLDDVQRQALDLIAAEVGPGPAPGHPILDADMRDTVKFYHLFINRRPEFESVAVAWYTKSKGHGPADPDIAHGLYWRAMREWQHFGTLRRAFEDTWPGGAP